MPTNQNRKSLNEMPNPRPLKKIKFTGFPDYHDPRKQPYFAHLSSRYDLLECNDPDYIIDGGQNFEHVKYDGIKILICSENEIPDFNTYDYAVSSSIMDLGDRHLRVPWCAFSPHYRLIGSKSSQHPNQLLERKFCSFIVSNVEFGDPIRLRFFKELSRYKKVDSGGRLLNNVGGAVKDKHAFCSMYKFNIAFENSRYPGYVTEKIVDAYQAKSIPIYYGNPAIETDFNRESMVYVKDETDIERAIEEIVSLDKDDEAYLKKVNAPCLPQNRSPTDYSDEFHQFLSHIFDQPLNAAHRLCPYGHQAMMRRHLRYIHGMDYTIGKSWIYRTAVGFLGRIRSSKAKSEALTPS